MSYELVGLLVLLGAAVILFAWSRRRSSASEDGWVETSSDTFEAGGLTLTASMNVREMPDEPLPPLGSVPGPAYRIDYVNGDGAASERVVTILDVTQDDGRTYILAYCSRVKANRTFRADR
ncbi:WYL domain-containing protein, partial [Bradyrhizobium sp. SBR1B]|uniref:WYL domain-containing protein n=1 Tax=Bradyrhizobium sp. SBR1B TaxID=2663836 RepID=UPI001AEE7B32